MLDNLSPEDIEALIALGVLPEEQAEVIRQQKLAESIRTQSGPQGRQAGGQFVAAHPLEFMGDMAQKYMAGQQEKELQKKQADILRQQTEARRKFFEAARNPGTTSPDPTIPPWVG